MPPGTLPDALFGVILPPSWRQVGPKVEFGRVGKPVQKKNENIGQQGNPRDPGDPGDLEATPVVPLKKPPRMGPQTLQGLSNTPLVPKGTVADFLYKTYIQKVYIQKLQCLSLRKIKEKRTQLGHDVDENRSKVQK